MGLRLLGLLLVLLGGCEVVRRLALAPVLDVATDPAGRAVDDLVAAACGGALVLCWLWIVACVLAVTGEVLRGLSRRSSAAVHPVGGREPAVGLSARAPRIITLTVLAVLGLGYGAAPALAAPALAGPATDPSTDPATAASALVGGLPLPDRVAAPAPAAAVATAPGGASAGPLRPSGPGPVLPAGPRTLAPVDGPATGEATTRPAAGPHGAGTAGTGGAGPREVTGPARTRPQDQGPARTTAPTQAPAPRSARPTGPGSGAGAPAAGEPSRARVTPGSPRPPAGTAGRDVHAPCEVARVVVRPGDSLWSIAATVLPDDAPPAAVDRAWRLIADANVSVLGDEPDLIFPGTTLTVPDLDPDPGEDRP